MRCPLCGLQFEEKIAACASCPLRRHCKLIKCPNCAFCFVEESYLGNLLRRLLKRDGRRVDERENPS